MLLVKPTEQRCLLGTSSEDHTWKLQVAVKMVKTVLIANVGVLIVFIKGEFGCLHRIYQFQTQFKQKNIFTTIRLLNHDLL